MLFPASPARGVLVLPFPSVLFPRVLTSPFLSAEPIAAPLLLGARVQRLPDVRARVVPRPKVY